MLTKQQRYARYKTMQDGLASLYFWTKQRDVANPSMNKRKEIDKEIEKTVSDVIPAALQLLSSTAEALHVIAEAQGRAHPGADLGADQPLTQG